MSEEIITHLDSAYLHHPNCSGKFVEELLAHHQSVTHKQTCHPHIALKEKEPFVINEASNVHEHIKYEPYFGFSLSHSEVEPVLFGLDGPLHLHSAHEADNLMKTSAPVTFPEGLEPKYSLGLKIHF